MICRDIGKGQHFLTSVQAIFVSMLKVNNMENAKRKYTERKSCSLLKFLLTNNSLCPNITIVPQNRCCQVKNGFYFLCLGNALLFVKPPEEFMNTIKQASAHIHRGLQ
jgi:hypothetical protein